MYGIRIVNNKAMVCGTDMCKKIKNKYYKYCTEHSIQGYDLDMTAQETLRKKKLTYLYYFNRFNNILCYVPYYYTA